ncbi:MAG: CDP-alcohol phosphatidyltransferase family protein [Lachnospiraceae bacterium]|nr:CDP-alcohol phosphatidyltransferase family protein [Lachnospiraceae bacterium]
MNRKIVGYYNYTVILTYCGLFSALLGIWRAMDQAFWSSVLFLMLAGLCDMFDGTVAATKERTIPERRFGIQIDSLSDLVSFGACPAIFVYFISGKDNVTGIICAVYILCGLIRLAYYNTLEEERLTREDRDPCFLGVPITSIAMTLPIFYLLHDFGVIETKVVFPVLLMLTGIGFLLPIRIKKPGMVGKVAILILGALELVGMMIYISGYMQ